MVFKGIMYYIVLKILNDIFEFMKITPRTITWFSLFKLPLVYLSGIRLKRLQKGQSVVVVRHRWINQNPFRSMFWAVQGMAAELATGVLLLDVIEKKHARISMLLTQTEATFSKKATGLIRFTCSQGREAEALINAALASGQGEGAWIECSGIDATGQQVCHFRFFWSVKQKN